MAPDWTLPTPAARHGPSDPWSPGERRRGTWDPDPTSSRAPRPSDRSWVSRRRLQLFYVVIVVDLILWAAVGVAIVGYLPGHHDRPGAPGSSGTPSGPTGSASWKIQHVVVVVLENREVNDVWALGPYERYLQGQYGNATAYFALCHGSPPNYLAMTSGRAEFCGSNVSAAINVTDLPDVVEQGGLSWAGYFESMPSPCYPFSTGLYLAWHNPFLSYDDIIENPSRCASHVRPSQGFNASVRNGTLPTVSFYVPNAWDDCDNSSLIVCDHWLNDFLSPILNSSSAGTQALVAHTAFFVVYDEGTSRAGFAGPVVTPNCLQTTGKALTVCGGRVYLSVVSPYSLRTLDTNDATFYNLESTIEWLFGLSSDGGYDGSSDFPAMTSLFTFSSNAS